MIGKDKEQTEFIRDNILELDEYPHLSDALDWVSDIWHRFREGDADLTVCVNHGPDDIALEDTPREHMCACVWRDGSYDYMLLDLVFEPGEMTLLGMLGERKQDFLLWMKGLVALYKLDIDTSAEKRLRKSDDLEEAREQLFFHNLITKDGRGKLSITQQGRRAIGRLVDEQEELLARFDIFRDVVIRSKGKGDDREMLAEFATLSGADYRVAIYQHEGVDPFRAVFILTLLSGELDDDLEGKGWLEVINDERYYEKILSPVIDHARLEPDELEELVRQGTQYLTRTAAQRERAAYSQRVLERAKTVQAFPRPRSKKKKGEESKKTFFTASEQKRSDELGAPPLPEDDEIAAQLPPADDEDPEERISRPPPAVLPEVTKARSTRGFGKREQVPTADEDGEERISHPPPVSSPAATKARSTRGFGKRRPGVQGGKPAAASKEPGDDDDGWL